MAVVDSSSPDALGVVRNLPILVHVDVDGVPVIGSCSHLAHDGTTPGDTGRHQTTRDDTWSRDPCLAAATLGSGARKGVGVRLSPLAPHLTCGSLRETLPGPAGARPSCSRLLTELSRVALEGDVVGRGRRQSQARSGEGHTREALQVGAATSRIVPSPPVVKPSCSGGVGPSHAHPDRANALELVRDVSGQRVRTVLKLLEQPPNRPLYDRAPRTPRPAPFIVPAPPSLPDPPTKLLVRRPEEAWLSGYRPRAVRHKLTESRAGRFRSVA